MTQHPPPDDHCRSLEECRPAETDTLLDRATKDVTSTR
jgi:hypothetical protein